MIWTIYNLFITLIYYILRIKQKAKDDISIPVATLNSNDIPKLNDGIISISFCPGRRKNHIHRNLKDDLSVLKDHGVTMIVSLVEPFEVEKMGYEDFYDKIREKGMKSLSYPIRDHLIPSDMSGYHDFILEIVDYLKRGEHILIHCNGGRGRATLTTFLVLNTLNFGYFKTTRLLHKLSNHYYRNPLQIIYSCIYAVRYLDIQSIYKNEFH